MHACEHVNTYTFQKREGYECARAQVRRDNELKYRGFPI